MDAWKCQRFGAQKLTAKMACCQQHNTHDTALPMQTCVYKYVPWASHSNGTHVYRPVQAEQAHIEYEK
jgi:hypothetical protein